MSITSNSFGTTVFFLLSSFKSTLGHKELEILSSRYKHFEYDFKRYWQGQVWYGHGRMWAWFPDEAVKLRYEGEVTNDQYGKINITTIIDSVSERLHVNFDFKDLDESQCVTYPFTVRHGVQQQIEKLTERDRCILKELGEFDVNFNHGAHQLQFKCPGVSKYDIHFSPEGVLHSVNMMRNGRTSKSITLRAPPVLSDSLPVGGEAKFSPPSGCELYSKVDDPLARIKLTLGQLRTPAQKSSVLSDMLMQVSKQHLDEMTQKGVFTDPLTHMRQIISLSAFELPGDIVVMMSEPRPPLLGGETNAIHFEYVASSYFGDDKRTSSGEVWLNIIDRAFRITALFPGISTSSVTFLVREQALSVHESRSLHVDALLAERLKIPAIYYYAETPGGQSGCSTIPYPNLTSDEAIDISRSLAAKLRFVEVGEERGIDCAIFSAPLNNRHYVYIFVDTEKTNEHDAILRIDIRNRTHVLRTTHIMKWHSHQIWALKNGGVMLPEKRWHCGTGPYVETWNNEKGHKNADRMMETLHAVRRLPAGSAMLDMLALPGDLDVNIKEAGSTSYLPTPAKKLHGFLGAGYKHYRFRYKRADVGPTAKRGSMWTGNGEVWSWFQKKQYNRAQGDVRLRIRWADSLERTVVTVTFDSRTNKMYIYSFDKVKKSSRCIMYPIESEKFVDSPDGIQKYFPHEHELVELHEIEAQMKAHGHYEMPWTRGQKVQMDYDTDGNFKGLLTWPAQGKKEAVKVMNVVGDVDEEDMPPVELTDIYGAPHESCNVAGASAWKDDPNMASENPIAYAFVKSPAVQDFVVTVRMDIHRHLWQILTVLVASLPGNAAVAAGPISPLGMLTAPYKHFTYDFMRHQRDKTFRGSGAMWVWIPVHESPSAVKMRFEGKTSSTRFGDIRITAIIDSATEQLHMNFELLTLSESQCITYPFTERRKSLWQMIKFLRRSKHVVEVENNMPVDFYHIFNWTRRSTLGLKFSDLDSLEEVFMTHRGRLIKEYKVTSDVQLDDFLPPEAFQQFREPEGCVMYNVVDDPLASMMERAAGAKKLSTPKAPHLLSSALSDLLGIIAKRNSDSLQQSGALQDPTLITLFALALPGDIAVMLEEPQPPNLAGDISALKYDYVSHSFKYGRDFKSSGTVWLNMTEGAFRLSGMTRKSMHGIAHVDLLARAGANPSKVIGSQPLVTPRVYCHAEFDHGHLPDCLRYDYPARPDSVGLPPSRSLAENLRFVEVSESQGEDCGIFTTELANGYYLLLWIDMEEEDHHAILRADIRNATQLLRRTEVSKWHDEATNFLAELKPPQEWHCHSESPANGPNGLAALSADPKNGASELVDTLYAVRNMHAGSAMLELLGLTGELEVQLKQNDNSGSYIPHPAQKIINFLKSGYKHFRFVYERQLHGERYTGNGELWIWFQDNGNGDESVKLRFRAESHTIKLGTLVNTIVVDSAQRVLYANFEERNIGESACTSYGFPTSVTASERVERTLKHDFVELHHAEELMARLASSATGVENISLPWSRNKEVNLSFDQAGEFLGMTTSSMLFNVLTPTKLLRIVGKVESSETPPPEITAIFDKPAKSCMFRDAVETPLAQIEMHAPHHRSASLREFLSIISTDAHRRMRQVLSLLVFSVPGDIPMLIQEPTFPSLVSYKSIAFDYTSSVYPGSKNERQSMGTVWSSEKTEHAFHLHGVSQPTVEFGNVIVDFIAHADPPAQVWANIELLQGVVQQCLSYEYPSQPSYGNTHMDLNRHRILFERVDQFQGDDYILFTTNLTNGRAITLWIDPDKGDHHAIKKIEVKQLIGGLLQTVRSTVLTSWRDGDINYAFLNPRPKWHCSPDDSSQADIAHFGLDRIRKKSEDLHELLFTLKTMDPLLSLLELLALPGDLSFELDGTPQVLGAGLQPGSTLPPWIHDKPLPNPASHSAPFGTISLLLALTIFLCALVIAIAIIGIISGGMSVPVLAVCPPLASALFNLQVAQFPARSRDTLEAIDHLCQFYAWVVPQDPLKTLLLSGLFLLAVSVQRALVYRNEASKMTSPNSQVLPHGLTLGAWELRALTFVAFPLAASSAQLIEDVDLFGLVGVAIIASLSYVAVTSLKFVTDAVEDKDVVCVRLPQIAGGAEIYIDRACTQLRALPARPPGPAYSAFLRNWVSSPSWCAVPAVAAIQDIEHSGARNARDDEYSAHQDSTSGLLCSNASAAQQIQDDSLEELRVEFESRPLLGQGDDVDSEIVRPSGNRDVGEGAGDELLGRRELSLQGCSLVEEMHPIRVKTTLTYDIDVDDLVAGVICIPWLDCAVPATALRRLEEVCGDITLQVHASQLSGSITCGKYAACFDWGTKWPWRWPLEIGMKTFIGIWVTLPISVDAFQGPITLLLHILVLCFVGTFTYGAAAVQPYSHGIDNISLIGSWTTVTLTLFVQSFGLKLQSLAFLATMGIAAALIALSLMALLASVAMTSVMLGRLEVQGLQDRFLPRCITGWGPGSFTRRESEAANVFESTASPGCGMTPESTGHCKNAVEVILPGPRPALAIVLPAIARPIISHAQLLPSSAARARQAEPLTTLGDRPRLPVPAHMLFPSTGHRQCSTQVAPIAALLAPGRPGRLVYSDPAENEDSKDWQDVVQKFFEGQGQQLADETLHLVQSSLAEGGAKDKLVVIEVLPALAAEFMDERFAAEEDRCAAVE